MGIGAFDDHQSTSYTPPICGICGQTRPCDAEHYGTEDDPHPTPPASGEINLFGERDALKWVQEFNRLYPNERPDTDTMLGWFANAIETGVVIGVKLSSEE